MSKLRDRVVVITGASSGIGRQAAAAFAERGAKLVLAARRRDALEEVAQSCKSRGGAALAVPMDVTREEQVEALVQQALAEYGRIDVWINNAGVTLFALLEEAPFDAHRRVIETNLLGSMLCARAVIPVFRRQKHGVLINVGSVLSKIGQPFVPSYAISKFGIQGLSEVLRVELADEPNIHVGTLYPYAVDTQHFQAGANWHGWQARAMPPMQSPEKVARALVDLAEHPVRERYVPKIAALGLALHRWMPNSVEQLLLHALRKWHFDSTPQSVTEGNLRTGDAEAAAVHGDRPPQTSTAGFALWTLGELLRIGFARSPRKSYLSRTGG
jgi:NAD(P)-dependent dehydrogenase (short-subunit alcohol dehydrogenase family)